MFAAIPEMSSRRPPVEVTLRDDDTPATPVVDDSTVARFRRAFLLRSHDNYAPIPTMAFQQAHDERPRAIPYSSGPRDDDDDDGDPKQ